MKNYFKPAVKDYLEHDHLLNVYAYIVFFITGENQYELADWIYKEFRYGSSF